VTEPRRCARCGAEIGHLRGDAIYCGVANVLNPIQAFFRREVAWGAAAEEPIRAG